MTLVRGFNDSDERTEVSILVRNCSRNRPFRTLSVSWTNGKGSQPSRADRQSHPFRPWALSATGKHAVGRVPFAALNDEAAEEFLSQDCRQRLKHVFDRRGQ